jgi:hypothetical protein
MKIIHKIINGDSRQMSELQDKSTMNTSGGGAVMGSFPYPRNGIVKLDFEYILLFKKQGDAPKPTAIHTEDIATRLGLPTSGSQVNEVDI